MTRIAMLSFVLAAACGGPPVLQNAPRPNPTAVAAGAAAVAGAATLADPAAAQKKQEEKKDGAPTGKAKKNVETVPPDVLDRLDAKKAAAPQ